MEELKNLRFEYGKQLVAAGNKNVNIIVLEADLKESTQSIQFESAFPDRFFEIGIAEQNMIGIAAGMARCGKIPVVHSFASFMSMKACEQVRVNLAFQKLNVKMVVSHAGVSAGSAGTSHHAIEDIAILRSMPNMKVLVPGDALDVKNCVEEMFDTKGPVYLRISASNVPDIINSSLFHTNGTPYLIQDGENIAIFTTGITLPIGKKVTDLLLSRNKITAKHLHFSTIKPINSQAIHETANKSKIIYTIEEHNIIGGFGSAVCEVVSALGNCKVIRLGIKDHYCVPASQNYIFEKEGLTPEHIYSEIIRQNNNDGVN
jgi:transketolase